MVQILSLIAGIFTILSAISYLRQTVRGDSIPNPATWLIWVVVVIINAATYAQIVDRNLWSALVSFVLAACIIIIFIFSLFKGKLAKLGFIEILTLICALLIGIAWRASGNAIVSNIALQVVFVISFAPTYAGLYRRVLREKPFPWFIAIPAYAISLVVLVINGEPWPAFVFPIVEAVLNGSVGIIAVYQNRVRESRI